MGEGRETDAGHSWSPETKDTDARTVTEGQGTRDREGDPSETDTAERAGLGPGAPSAHACLLSQSTRVL